MQNHDDIHVLTSDSNNISHISNESDMENFTTYVDMFGTPDNRTWTSPLLNPVVRNAFIAAYVTVFFMCVIGNSLVLYAVTSNSRMRSRTNLFLANLAVADLCVGIFCVPPALYRFLIHKWHLGRIMCKLYKFVDNLNITASMLFLAVMAVERYIAIIHPLQARRFFTQYKMYLAQFLVWLVSSAYNSPFLFIYDLIEGPQFDEVGLSISFCVFKYHHSHKNMEEYYVCTFVLWYLVPLLVMSVLYFKIAHTLWRSGVNDHMVEMRRRIGSVASSNLSEDCQESSSKIQIYRRTKMRRSFSDIHPNIPEMSDKSDEDSNDEHEAPFILQDGFLDPSMATSSQCATSSGRTNATRNNTKPLGAQSENDKRRVQSPRKLTRQEATREESMSSFSFKGFSTSQQKMPMQYSYSSNSSDEGGFLEAETSLHNASQPIFTGRNNQLTVPRTQEGSKNRLNAVPNVCRYRVKSQRASRRRVIVLLLVVLTAFAVLVLPNHIKLLSNLFSMSIQKSESSIFYSMVCPLLVYFHSALNPILYSLLSKSFRQGLIESLRCYCRRRRNSVDSHRTDGSTGSSTKRTSC